MSGILHFFNPSHDEALASGSPFYTPSQVARRMEEELEDFPRLWAERCDFVPSDLFSWLAVTHIEPWGWDARARFLLRKAGAPEEFLPSDKTLEHIRRLSSRQMVSTLLPKITGSCEGTFGESHFCTSETEVREWLSYYGDVMLKSPWSCSGRGVFRCSGKPQASVIGRVRRIIKEQGGIEVQPFHTGGHDFAMEFECRDSKVYYQGISMFLTSAGGQYVGNIIDSEENLRLRLENLSPKPLHTRNIYNNVQQKLQTLLSLHVAPFYDGPLGVDMLLVGESIQPMIELNLRRTMGSVAICLRSKVAEPFLLSIATKDGHLEPQIRKYNE